MVPDSDLPDSPVPLRSRGYRITVDDGRESFWALCIEADTTEDAWLMSDTVVSLKHVR